MAKMNEYEDNVELRIMAMCLVSAFCFVSCSNDDEEENNEVRQIFPVDEVTRTVLEGSRDMALPFFSEVLADEKEDVNVMVSPLSLTEVLTMMANGANGKTQKQILELIGNVVVTPEAASAAMKTMNCFLPTACKT